MQLVFTCEYTGLKCRGSLERVTTAVHKIAGSSEIRHLLKQELNSGVNVSEFESEFRASFLPIHCDFRVSKA